MRMGSDYGAWPALVMTGQMYGRGRPDGPVRGANHYRFTKNGQEPQSGPGLTDFGFVPLYGLTECGPDLADDCGPGRR